MVGSLFNVSVVPGIGVVARQGPAVLVANPVSAMHEQFVDQLLATLAEAATDQRVHGRVLVRRVAASVALATPEDVPAFGLVTPLDDDLVALLAGDVRLRITREDGDVELSGTDATTYLEQIIRGQFRELLLTYVTDATPDPRSSLTAGVIRGAGVLLVPADPSAVTLPDESTRVDLSSVEVPSDDGRRSEPAESSAHEPDADESAATPEVEESARAFVSIPLFGDEAEEEQPQDAGPGQADGEHAEASVEVEVEGIVCARGHFNNPESRFCARCGISMVHQTHHLVKGVRPPLGVLVTDDGAVHALSADVVIGRDPESADDVVAGSSRALSMEDTGGSMSRVHARIVLRGWDVQVVDAASANGTFVAPSADAEWSRLEPGVPTALLPGWRISMGGRTLTFESHQKH